MELNTINILNCIDVCNHCYWDFVNFLYSYNVFSFVNTLPILFLNRFLNDFSGDWGIDFEELLENLDEMTIIKDRPMDTFYEMDKIVEIEHVSFFKFRDEFWYVLSMLDYF